MTSPDPIITAPIDAFCRMSGLGRTKIYELLGDGTLASITVGKRRLVVLDSYRRLIDAQRTATPANEAGALASRRRNPTFSSAS